MVKGDLKENMFGLVLFSAISDFVLCITVNYSVAKM